MLVALLLAALILTLLPSGSVGKNEAQRLSITIALAHPERPFAPGAVGISLEDEELDSGDLDASHRSLVALMRQLGPGVLRFGGGSVDSSWWTSRAERPPAWATSVITPAELTTLRKLLTATGWRAILGVNLGHFDPSRAANEAQVSERILGHRLLGFEIGNEPDKFSDPVVKLRPASYSLADYLGELSRYSVAMFAAAPGIQLYGPDLSSQGWLRAIASDRAIPLTAITLHFYPTSYSIPKGACKGTPTPTAFEILSPQVRERENVVLQTLLSAGDFAQRETRVDETNTTSSCDYHGGPATSPVFASALWSFDWVLRAASAGVAGLNFHGDFGHCAPDTFSPICARDVDAAAVGEVMARPEYYGLLAARELEGGRFVSVGVSGHISPSNLTAFATLHSSGVVTLAVDNFAAHGSSVIALSVPGYRKATAQRLLAPAVSSTSGVTFGNASFDAAGGFRSKRTKLKMAADAFHFEMGPESAIVVTLAR